MNGRFLMAVFGDTELADAFDAGDHEPTQYGTGRYLLDLAEVLRAAGLDVTEQDGWTTRARSSGGYPDGKPWAIMWHHAASAPGSSAEAVANYASYGSDVAPVCNLVLGRDGAVIVCAAGATNTNGTGGPVDVSSGRIPVDQMNTHAIGIEAVNTGVGEAWPEAQIDAYFTMSIALAEAYGLDAGDIVTHAVWAPGRKIDPATAEAVEGPWRPRSTTSSGTWNLDDIRAEAVRRATVEPEPEPEPEPLPPQEDPDMPLTFVAAAPDYATVLVAIDGAGTSVLAFATEPDREAISAAIGNPPIVHLTAGQMAEILARAGLGEES